MSEDNKIIKHNCLTCHHGLFARCKGLKENKDYQDIWAPGSTIMEHMKKSHDFKENHVCDEYNCMFIEYPIEVSKINYNTKDGYGYRSDDVGKFVKVTLCKEEYRGKTFLGLYLGDLPKGIHMTHDRESKELTAGYHTNPAMFVFELNKIVFGVESFWGIIESEDDLEEITQEDIDNVWYVKALKAVSKTTPIFKDQNVEQ